MRKKSESSVTKESTRSKGSDPVQAIVANAADSRKRPSGEKVETSGVTAKKAKASVPGKFDYYCFELKENNSQLRLIRHYA